MEALVFRGMFAETTGAPSLGRGANQLGVRIPIDLSPDTHNNVHPNSGGMSVAPESYLNVPNHRRPKAMGFGSTGPDRLRVYGIAVQQLDGDSLSLRSDPKRPSKHAFVEPRVMMPLLDFEACLGATQHHWKQIWPAN